MNPIPEKEQAGYARARLAEFDTSELIEIWQENDRGEWTDADFAVIHDILLERIHRVPLQRQATKESRDTGHEQVTEAAEDTNQEEEGEEYTYHDFDTMVRISTIARTLSWVFLAMVVLWLGGIAALYVIPNAGSSGGSVWNGFAGVLFIAFLAVLLRAIAEGIYVLLDIEDNTHRVATAVEKRLKETSDAVAKSI